MPKQPKTNKRIIATSWHTLMTGHTIGIVAVKRRHVTGWKAFIGIPPVHIDGPFKKSFDTRYIADLGSPLTEEVARAYFPKIDMEYVY